jgi:hypothetical protein
MLLSLVLAACAWSPDAHHQLIAKVGHNGVYFLVSEPSVRFKDVPTTQMTLDRLSHISAQPAEIERYARSQIKWIGSKAKIEFHTYGTERLVAANGEYFVMVSVDFIVPEGPNHGACSQLLSVVVSLAGDPIYVLAGTGDMQTCLASAPVSNQQSQRDRLSASQARADERPFRCLAFHWSADLSVHAGRIVGGVSPTATATFAVPMSKIIAKQRSYWASAIREIRVRPRRQLHPFWRDTR